MAKLEHSLFRNFRMNKNILQKYSSFIYYMLNYHCNNCNYCCYFRIWRLSYLCGLKYCLNCKQKHYVRIFTSILKVNLLSKVLQLCILKIHKYFCSIILDFYTHLKKMNVYWLCYSVCNISKYLPKDHYKYRFV